MRKLSNLRHRAFVKQKALCYYCRMPMWESSPDSFAATHEITRAQARNFQCTAEHLHAKCDGGKDSAFNIVAACFRCNNRRHKCTRPLDAIAYKERVRNAMARGKWLDGCLRNLARQTISVDS